MSKNKLPNWDLSEIYLNYKDPKIEKDQKKINNSVKTFVVKWKGKIKTLDGNEISNCLREYEKINEKLGLLSTHSSLSFAGNMEDEEISRYNSKISDWISQLFSKIVFVSLEIASVNDKVFNQWVKNKYSKRWIPLIKNLRKRRRFQLSPLVEEILIEKSATGRSAWVRLFDETSAALRFPFNKQLLTEAEILNKLSDSNSENRKIAGKSLSKVLKENKKIFGMILNVISRDKFIEDNKRGFKSSLSSRNLDNDVEDEVVDSLVKAVDEQMPNLTHRYYKWKAKEFKKKKLDWWDRNAPLSISQDENINWDKAKSIVLDSFDEFNPKVSQIAEKFFKNNWIDADVRIGKASGAFAHPSVPSLHPYILVNYQGKVRDIMTLAHELGHGIHQVLASKQGLLLSDTPLTLAETASVFGEMLVFRNLLNQSSKKKRKEMLANKIEDMLNTVARQIGFHQFEYNFHDSRKYGELTPDEISDIWIKTQKHAVGPYVKLDENYRSLWAYIPHFIHTPFYVYAYAFGDCLVNALWAEYQKSDKKDFSELYIDLLSSGGSKDHHELLKPFGLSVYKKNFWHNGLKSITNMIDELETL